jgi:hypothetical protein
MSTTPQISGTTKFRRSVTYTTWGLGVVLFAVVAITEPKFLGNAIETVLAIFAFGVLASTKQSTKSFLIASIPVVFGLILGFTQIFVTDRSIVWTVINAAVTIGTLGYAAYGPGQQHYLKN